MSLKTVYCYGQNGVYIGDDYAQEDPMNQGEYLIPQNATSVEPPACSDNEFCVFLDGEWVKKNRISCGTYFNKSNPTQKIIVENEYCYPQPEGIAENYTLVPPKMNTMHQEFNLGDWQLKDTILNDVVEISWVGDTQFEDATVTVKIKDMDVISVSPSDPLHDVLSKWPNITQINFEKYKNMKIKSLMDSYYKSTTITVNNGVLITFRFGDSTGSALMDIISNAQGAYDDITIAKKIQKFWAIESLNNFTSSQQEAGMLNWLWLYIFGELPELHKKIKQKLELYKIQINSAKSIEQLDAIDFDFYCNGWIVDISEVMRFILANDTDVVGDRQIQIPGYVKQAIKNASREVFYEATQESIMQDIHTIVGSSFLNFMED